MNLRQEIKSKISLLRKIEYALSKTGKLTDDEQKGISLLIEVGKLKQAYNCILARVGKDLSKKFLLVWAKHVGVLNYSRMSREELLRIYNVEQNQN